MIKTAKSADALKQIDEALVMLEAWGIPVNLTKGRLEKMALAFLAVAGMTPGKKWAESFGNNENHRLSSREIIAHVNKYYEENISRGAYDDIRRKDLKFLTEAGIVIPSSADPNAATTDPTRRYALDPKFAAVIRLFPDGGWEKESAALMADRIKLCHALKCERVVNKVPIFIDGKALEFSPGIHNEIQKAIIEEFLPRYGYGAKVLYVGDTAEKFKFLDKETLDNLKFFDLSHGKLPDLIAYSRTKNWLYLIEAVHSANPISPLRHHELKRLAKNCTAGVVYVTAFLNRKSSKKFIDEIAWETEVWIADNPDHLVHFDGGRFLGPYKT